MSRKQQKAVRGTLAQHGKLRTPKPLAQLLGLIGVGIAAVMVAVIGVAGYVAYDFTTTYSAGAVDLGTKPPDISELKGGTNILIAGTDQCEPQFAKYFGDRCSGDSSEEAGARSDVNLVVHISPEPRRITVLSFPRDLLVEIPECTNANGDRTPEQSRAMINSAFDVGGLACTVKTVEKLTGLKIPYAASVNFGGVMEMTDALGGVKVCLAKGIDDPYTGMKWPAGERVVKGYEALQFLRTRHGVGDGSDLGRISNQQQYMSRLAKQLLSSDTLTDIPKMLKLARSALKAVDPSTSLTDPMTLVQIASAVKSVEFKDIAFVQYPVVDDPYDPNRVIPNEEAAKILMDAVIANKPIKLTGGAGNGVVAKGGGTTTPPTGGTSTGGTGGDGSGSGGSTTPSANPTTPPKSGTVELPSDVTGTTADEETCSAGNVD